MKGSFWLSLLSASSSEMEDMLTTLSREPLPSEIMGCDPMLSLAMPLLWVALEYPFYDVHPPGMGMGSSGFWLSLSGMDMDNIERAHQVPLGCKHSMGFGKDKDSK